MIRQVMTARFFSASVSLTVALILLTLAPFAAALEVHHELARADHDGHQHSDSDLCQWIQHHTGSSLLTGLPAVAQFVTIAPHDVGTPGVSDFILFSSSGPPRGPPRF